MPDTLCVAELPTLGANDEDVRALTDWLADETADASVGPPASQPRAFPSFANGLLPPATANSRLWGAPAALADPVATAAHRGSGSTCSLSAAAARPDTPHASGDSAPAVRGGRSNTTSADSEEKRRVREKNKYAQKRYREKQRDKMAEMESRTEVLREQLGRVGAESAALQRRNQACTKGCTTVAPLPPRCRSALRACCQACVMRRPHARIAAIAHMCVCTCTALHTIERAQVLSKLVELKQTHIATLTEVVKANELRLRDGADETQAGVATGAAAAAVLSPVTIEECRRMQHSDMVARWRAYAERMASLLIEAEMPNPTQGCLDRLHQVCCVPDTARGPYCDGVSRGRTWSCAARLPGAGECSVNEL